MIRAVAISFAVAMSPPAVGVRPDVGFRLDSERSPQNMTGWLKSTIYRVCQDPENCGPYPHQDRCRDAFCAGCSVGSCETLEEAQLCCEESDDCTAVYGGGAHWWTFHSTCHEENHPNYYNVWHRGGEQPPIVEPPAPSTPAPAPPPQPIPAPSTPAPAPPPQPIPAPSTPAPAPPPQGPDADFPAGLLVCNAGAPPLRTSCANPSRLAELNQRIRNAVVNHHNSLPSRCDNSGCPRGDLAGCLVRLTGHDIMDFNRENNNGGADGCIDFQDPDNLGLKGCMLESVSERDSSNISLELMWQDFCQEVSIADFFVIAAEALMEATAPGQHRGMWSGSFRNGFKFGRQTALSCNPEALPNPIHACDAVEEVFIERMGLTPEMAAALMGVHTLGRALPENSGYDGFWVSQQHAKTFSHHYYKAIIAVGWKPARTIKGKMQWNRADVDPDHHLHAEMMLNTDMCLAYQSGNTKPYTRSEDDNHTGCCLWMDEARSTMSGVSCFCQGQDISVGCTHVNCCRRALDNCRGSDPMRAFIRSDAWPFFRRTLGAVTRYAKDSTGTRAWHDDFMQAWRKTTEQGHELC